MCFVNVWGRCGTACTQEVGGTSDAVVDLTEGGGAGVGGTGPTLAEARAFYREHADEIVSRMRKPTSLTNNPAAAIVAQCETDPRLRTEALCAVDDARRARDALAVLKRTLDVRRHATVRLPVGTPPETSGSRTS